MRQGIIAAVSTPPGKGGVAIIRVCGDGTLELCERVFSPISNKKLSDYKPRTQVYGYIIKDGERIDDGMATYFPKPNSYTGEETVEFSCHGGILVTRTVLEALFSLGVLPARAGEFTERAFLNGKLTLTEAEAIGNLLEAKSHEQILLASSDSRARLKDKISAIRADITTLLSSAYARIDYPDEDLGDFTDEEAIERLEAIKSSLQLLISTYRTGRSITEGVKTTLCGKTNAGKSTVYNLLLGEDAAIVTDIEGTTRDLLVSECPLGRVMLTLADTAGIRNTEEVDRVEKIGIERSKSRIRESELIITVFDLYTGLDEKDYAVLAEIKGSPAVKIALLNKTDISTPENIEKMKGELKPYFEELIEFSDKDREASIKRLEKAVTRLFTDEKVSTTADAIVASARQHGSLCECLSHIDAAISAFRMGLPQDLCSSDIELALGAIAEVDGVRVSDEVVRDIFSRFCVGK